MWHTHDGMGWWMVFGGLFWLLVWVMFAYVIVTFVGGRRAEESPSRPPDPLDIAKRRYAAGEITREQYHQLRADLTGQDRPSPPAASPS